jgi:Na+/phosphate symporter
MSQGALATAGTLRDIHEMCQKTIDMLRLTWDGFRRQDTGPLETADNLGRDVHRQEKVLTEAMVKGPPGPPGSEPSVLFVPMHLERIGVNIEGLIAAVRTMVREGVPFTDRAMREVNGLFEKAIELLECARDAVVTENRVLIRHILDSGTHYARLADDYALAHQRRLVEGLCLAQASSVYLAILDYLKGVEGHARQIAQKLSASRGA